MKYLITGSTGFIGPHLVKKLATDGHNCRCLVREGSDTGRLQDLGAELMVADITQAETLTGAADGVDRVLHLATLGHMSNYTVTESMFQDINVRGAINVMQEALRAGIPRVVHCSTVAAMGICSEVPANEKSQCKPHHPYGRSKLKAEQEILSLVAQRSLPAVIVRFSMVYGPGDPRDILKLTRLARKGLFPKIGRRPKLTPLIHVDDAVQGLLQAAEKGTIGEIYLLTNRNSLPFDDIRKLLQTALGISRLPLYIPEWVALMIASLVERIFSVVGRTPPVSRKNIESILADRVFSIDKAATDFDFCPRVDPAAGLKETVEWYRKQEWV